MATVPIPALSVIVPAFNEEARLPKTLRRIRDFCDGRGSAYEVLVVDDGSLDGTLRAIREVASAWPRMRVISLPQNEGKGAAVRAGMLAARGARRLFTDADMSTPIEEVVKLEAALERGADVGIGSRAAPDSRVEVGQPQYRRVMGRSYSYLLRRLALPGLRDTQCGFKLFTAEAAAVCFTHLGCRRFGFDAEVLLRAQRRGMKVAEVGVVWRHESGSRVRPWADGAAMVLDLWRLHRQLDRASSHRSPAQAAGGTPRTSPAAIGPSTGAAFWSGAASPGARD